MEQPTTANGGGMPFYRYYQLGEYDNWSIRQDLSPTDPWGFATTQQAERVSIMCVSEDLDLAREKDSVEYAGNLFFDIDDKDLAVALKSANQLVAKLLALGVHQDDIECHLSGKKGVHIYLNQQIFCKDASVPLLPEIYARVAMSLWVDGMDFAVYSAGKGRMVRPVNAVRPDGKYKVQVSLAEMRDISTDGYKHLCGGPRAVIPKGPCTWAPKLAKIFSTCKEAVTRPKAMHKAVPPADLAKLGQEIPDCIEMIAKGQRKKIKGDGSTSFNALAMQVGCWSKSTTIDNVVLQGLQERLAKNNPSSSGESQHSRVRKLQSMHHYLRQQERYQFSCSAIKKLIEGTPACSSCPVFTQGTAMSQVSEAMFLVEHQGHYYGDKDKTILIAPFTMVRDAIVKDENSMKTESSTVIVQVPLSGESFKLFNFSEEAWISKQNFKKEITGIDGASFFGSDNDVSRLKMTLFRDDLLNGAEVKEVFTARKIGVNYSRRHGPESARDPDHRGKLVYVEPDFSVNQVGIQNTHILVGEPAGAPNMKLREFNDPLDPKAEEAFKLLLQTNSPQVVSTILGWFLATHLKSHFYAIEHRFPLLCISGVAGTGKNSSIAVFMRLCGVEGERALLTLEVPQATQFPFQEALTNSSTIPRVINEMNPKSTSQNNYTKVIEMIKSAFDSQHVSRGRIGGGDRASGLNVSTLHWKITAPVVTLSEEPIGSPAVLQRAIMLDLTLQGLLSGKAAFHELEKRADDLVDIGRILIRESLKTTVQELIAILDGTQLPDNVRTSDIPERLKYGYRVLLSAYTWAHRHLAAAGMSEANLDNLMVMRENFLDYIAANSEAVSAESGVTEIDLILKTFAIIAHSSESDHATQRLIKGFHYVVQDGRLYLDVYVAYPILQAYKRGVGEPLSIHKPAAFLKVVKSMAYYESDKAICALLPTQGRPVLALNIELMASRDIPVEMFL